MLKVCVDCCQPKERSAFYRNSTNADGRFKWCKDCHKIRLIPRMEAIRAYDRQRGQLPERKRIVLARAPKYKGKPYRQIKAMRASHPEAAAARAALGNAVRDGRIVKPLVCEGCGAGGKLHGHHEDYSKPLEVDWLCSKCHGARHREINEERRVGVISFRHVALTPPF
jgi:hypothetical protein